MNTLIQQTKTEEKNDQIMFSAHKPEKITLSVHKDRQEIKIKSLVERLNDKYSNMENEEREREFVRMSSLASYILQKQGGIDPAKIRSFVIGFTVGEVFGKNGLIISAEREAVSEEEYRSFVAEMVEKAAEGMQELSKKIKEGDYNPSFMEIANFNDLLG